MNKKYELSNSWYDASILVLLGMALGALTLNFWGLDYILPTAGAVLSLLGFRRLRGENLWFTGCYILAILRLVYIFGFLIANTTILLSLLQGSPILSALMLINPALTFAMYCCFWMALRTMQSEAGEEPHAAAAFAVVVWYAVLCLIALHELQGLIFVAIILAGLFLVFYRLYRLLLEMNEDGYEISPAAAKLSDRTLLGVLAAVLLVGSACGFLFGSRYPMNYHEVNGGEKDNEIRAHLAELGFPIYVLDDLSESDLALCKDAVQVVFSESDEPVTYADTEFAENELRLTSVGVQLAEETGRWIIFHHFLWTSDPGFCGTECLQVMPAWQNEGWSRDGDPTGRVLYDRDGKTYGASFYTLGTQTVPGFFVTGADNIFAGFSMPYRSENQRGYIAYPVLNLQSSDFLTSRIYYTHQKTWLQYPARTAVDIRTENPWNNGSTFQTVQSVLQFKDSEKLPRDF